LELCQETLPLLTASLPDKVRLKIELPNEGPIIRADAAQIRQVLTNLVVNAGEAIGEREGVVTLTIGVMSSADIQDYPSFPPEWGPKDESYACLSVSDTGAGMDPETLEKAFDPFFSTNFGGRVTPKERDPMNQKIASIRALEILDSRENPTIRVFVSFDNGIKASASVPSGASTSEHETVELRDGDKRRYDGKGMLSWRWIMSTRLLLHSSSGWALLTRRKSTRY
jgi:hypothetical protein